MKKNVLIALLQVLFLSSVFATGESITIITNNGPTSPTGLGFVNPCSGVGFQVTPVVPSGYAVQKSEWYADNVLVKTVTGDNPNVLLAVTSNNFTVYCVETYKQTNGTQTSSGTSNSVEVLVNIVFLNSIIPSGPPATGCTSLVNYGTSVASGMYLYTPAAGNYSINWTLPANWSFSGASTGLSITAIPDGGTAGNVTATLTLAACPYQTHTAIAITRTVPVPVWSSTGGSGPFSFCAGSTTTYAINPSCGAISYTWSITGNGGVTFTSNGSQSLTTSATSVDLAASSSASSGNFTVSVVANYSGASSPTLNGGGHIGVPTDPVAIQGMAQGSQLCEGTLFNVYTGGQPSEIASFIWGLSLLERSSPGIYSGQGTTEAYVQLPTGYTYSNEGDVVDGWLISLQAQNACGTSNWETTVSGDVTGCNGGTIGTSTRRAAATGIAGGLNNPGALSVFPNPAQNIVNVTLPGNIDAAKATITLSDIYGRQLKRVTTVNSVNTFNLSGLAAGIYLVQIYDGKKVVSTQKVVKK